jgi:regulator of sirC expression with transglutaminase-like and TPR domain
MPHNVSHHPSDASLPGPAAYMAMGLPLCCRPEAFSFLAQQISVIDSPDALLNSAIAIAMHETENLDPQAIDKKLQQYADTVRQRVRGQQPQALLAHLHQFLFEEENFAGNSEDYYNSANSYLPQVLENKLGLPITLSLVYKAVAERLGFRTWGVGLPGHFLVGLQCEESELLVDCFGGGRLLNSDEAHECMREIFGPEVEWSESHLSPVTHRHWLTRMLQNLLNIFGSANRYADVAAMLEMEILLWPEQQRLQRDLALVLARLGRQEAASHWLDAYLKKNPDDPQSGDLKQLLEVLTA